ncbi:hypothetical protein EWM64_g10517 [Hericium alpestre]|uniref:RNase H type-1 domain-containing protein n=1 Tax=Hericium alpestre TaxID=135208 RepID=A0A4Y9ZFH9_9AGAM|nr:hypothetical protein EWM64_g10517 [Hericium alpestre]
MSKGLRAPGPTQSNQVSGLVAVILALQHAPDFAPILIRANPGYVKGRLTKHPACWEDHGPIGVENAAAHARAAAYHLRRHSATTAFQWVKGHNGDAGDEAEDSKHEGWDRKIKKDDLDLYIPCNLLLQGAKLAAITPSTACQSTRTRANPASRRKTMLHPNFARYALEEITGCRETDATLWKHLRKTERRFQVRCFLYRAIHNACNVGSFREKIAAFAHRATCLLCEDEVKPMMHLLTQSSSLTVRDVWSYAQILWPQGDTSWPKMNSGTILSVGTAKDPFSSLPPKATTDNGPRLSPRAS